MVHYFIFLESQIEKYYIYTGFLSGIWPLLLADPTQKQAHNHIGEWMYTNVTIFFNIFCIETQFPEITVLSNCSAENEDIGNYGNS